MSSIEIPSNYNSCKTHEDKLVMLLEREEYEPLSRAAYYHSPRKDQEKNVTNYESESRTLSSIQEFFCEAIQKNNVSIK